MDPKCIDGGDHDLKRVGYLVCASEPSSKRRPIKQGVSGTYPLTWSGSWFPITTFWDNPVYLTADIEVLQCTKCGDVKFMPAVFDKICGGDQECQE